MDGPTRVWWVLLCAEVLVNVSAWSLAAPAVPRQEPSAHAALTGWPAQTMLLLPAGYVFGGAYRSALPGCDIQRLCLIDGPWSSVLVGRSVATVAGLCLAAQWAVALRHLAQRSGACALAVSGSILPMIGAAELWVSLYLSAAVWLSIALVHAPHWSRAPRPG
jgi:hypothetical protein